VNPSRAAAGNLPTKYVDFALYICSEMFSSLGPI